MAKLIEKRFTYGRDDFYERRRYWGIVSVTSSLYLSLL